MKRIVLDSAQREELQAILRKHNGWVRAYRQQGATGLVSHYPGWTSTRSVARLEAKVLNCTLKHMPKDGPTHWSSRKLAAELGDISFKRNGALSLFAAFNTATGEVLGKTAERHTSEQFVEFLQEIVTSQDVGRDIHVICDNVSSHKTERVRQFLVENLRVQMHDTPPLRPGSIRLKTGSHVSSAMSSPVEFLPPQRTLTKN